MRLHGDTPLLSRRRPFFILLAMFALLVPGCSSSRSESANTEAATFRSTAESSTSDTTATIVTTSTASHQSSTSESTTTTVATSTTSTTAEATSPDELCVFDPAQDVDTAPIDLVAEAIACDREGFRTIMIDPLAEFSTLAVVDGFGLDFDSATRFEECAGRVLAALSDSDLISLAKGIDTAYDYGAAISTRVMENCLSSIGTLNGLTDDEILDAVIDRTADEVLWERTGPVFWNSNWISMAQTDQVAIVVILEQHSRLALMTSIGFEPAVEHSTAAMALDAFLGALGVDASPALIDQILDGTALPSSETIQFCAGLEAGEPVVMASPLAMSCPEFS